MTNRLADETSPYLRQHRNNPVDWHPWGPEALERSRREDKPIFLSIGYSACHWCHVMEHESFEDDAIAAKLNEAFVCIKVDREERPDLDQIYMNAVQMLTGRGGWPMSVFLTPEGKPFYGGTYWPPTARGGMHGFDEIIAAVSQAWANRREVALTGADQLTEELQKIGNFFSTEGELSRELLDASEAMLRQAFDATNGGFGGAPKFPHPMQLRLLLREWRRTQHATALDMVRLTLDRMASGGIYDHLGGGFARYSVDARWLVPHFEKMLYDNALLAGAYLDGYLATGDQEYARVSRETLDYVLRDMTDPAGGFYSSEDADSEDVEGKFYVWTPVKLREVLGDEAAATFARVYDVTDEGNFEGANILNRSKTMVQNAAILGRDEHELADELAASRAKLLAARSQRVRPGRDDKVLVSWNALVIDSLARAGAALGEPRYVEAAVKAADFILDQLSTKDGRLLHTWRGGVAKLDAYLDDYASMAVALVSVYEATFDESFLDEAIRLAELILQQFSDAKEGGFFYTASDHEALIARTKDMTDSSLPSGSALAATALVLLGKLTGRSDLTEAAVATMQSAVGVMRQSPLAAGQMLLALDLYLGPSYEVVIVGDADSADTQAVLDDLRGRFLPNKVVAWRSTASTGGATAYRSPALDALFAGRESKDGTPTAYVCQDSVCSAPIVSKEAIVTEWERLAVSRVS